MVQNPGCQGQSAAGGAGGAPFRSQVQPIWYRDGFVEHPTIKQSGRQWFPANRSRQLNLPVPIDSKDPGATLDQMPGRGRRSPVADHPQGAPSTSKSPGQAGPGRRPLGAASSFGAAGEIRYVHTAAPGRFRGWSGWSRCRARHGRVIASGLSWAANRSRRTLKVEGPGREQKPKRGPGSRWSEARKLALSNLGVALFGRRRRAGSSRATVDASASSSAFVG